jgi:hypothetical protein
MSLKDSPTFDDAEVKFDPFGDLKKAKETGSQIEITRFRQFLLGLFATASLLIIVNLFVANGSAGSLTGYVVDLEGKPLSAEVFLLGTETGTFSDNTGYFEINNVPIGSYELIIGYNGIGQVVDVNVPFAGRTNTGNIVVDTTWEDG